MLKKKTILLLLAVLLVLPAGCGSKSSGNTAAPAPSMPPSGPSYDRAGPEYGEQGPYAPPSKDSSAGGAAQQRIIQNAERSYDVEDMDKALAELQTALRAAGGIVADSHQSGRKGEFRSASLTLRVPAASFDSFLDEVEKVGKFTSGRKYIHDVTMQYIDLEARIRNLERQEERLLDVLDRADTVEDILRVEQELSRIRGQLESFTAEFRYLRDRVEYSTVHIYLRETATASPVITGSGLKGVWQRGMSGLINSVNSMLTGVGNFIVLGFRLLPYLVLIFVLLLPVVLIFRRRGGGPRAPQA
ncbi:MAG: DUF4349 domain-containing protein [Dethiobacter sp.]|jgi:hypothetical protein|nr:DUF4349 domain-containing protein [Dethiobacter sp.]